MSATPRFAQRSLVFGWAMVYAILVAEPRLRAEDEILVTLRPLLERHCLDCHDSGEAEGGVDLGTWVDETSVLHDPDLMLRVKAAVSEYRMPPSDQELLGQEDRDRFGSILESVIARFDATQPALAGMTPVRRLNRREYRNTLRDLLGIRLDEQLELPADDSAFGFDHVAEASSLSPVTLGRYEELTERVLSRVLIEADTTSIVEQLWDGRELRGGESLGDSDSLLLGMDREAGVRVELLSDGDYELRIEASRRCATGEAGTLVLLVDGVERAIWTVSADESSSDWLEVELPMQRGERRLALRHTWHTATLEKGESLPEIVLKIDSVAISGPTAAVAKRRWLGERLEGESDESYGTRATERFISAAFRRRVLDEELQSRVKLLHERLEAGESLDQALRWTWTSILVSPHFLLHLPMVDEVRDEFGNARLDADSLASRLSYFLWSTLPDDELRELARTGRIHDREELQRQVLRMMQDDKADAFIESFSLQWLGLRKLETLELDRDLFRGFDAELRRAMREEGRLFFETMVREDRDVGEFVTANWTWMNEPLARLYGRREIRGQQFQRVEHVDPMRGGVISMPGVLAATSLPTRTSAVKRGKWLLDEILGASPPPPPPSVPSLDGGAESGEAGGSLRERLERHRADPKCYTCHVQMDVLGLGLENFDPLGRWRDREGEVSIDASGTLPDGRSFETVQELREILASRRSEFLRCFVEKVFVYAMARGVTRHDRAELERIVSVLEAEGGRFSTLVRELVGSRAFQYRSVDAR